ncbi:MAG: hypothetical protein AB7E05_10850 [Sphingobium sp.]
MAMNGCFSNSAIGEVIFGAGCLASIGRMLERDGIGCAVIVTGPSLLREGALLAGLKRHVGLRLIRWWPAIPARWKMLPLSGIYLKRRGNYSFPSVLCP